MNVRFGPKLRIASAGLAIVTLVGFVPGANAAETEYGGSWCMHVKSTVLESNPEVTTLTIEGWGITTPMSTFKPWENATVRCVGYVRIFRGKPTSIGSCRWVDSTGDTFTGEYEQAPDAQGKWTFLSGTGKWKGIQGNGVYKTLNRGKPAAPGTSQLCNEHAGSYTLP